MLKSTIFDKFYIYLCTQTIKKVSKIILKKLNFAEFIFAIISVIESFTECNFEFRAKISKSNSAEISFLKVQTTLE